MYYLLPLRWALLFATVLNALVAPAVAAWWAGGLLTLCAASPWIAEQITRFPLLLDELSLS